MVWKHIFSLPKIHVPMLKQFHGVLQFYGTMRIINQRKFKVHWWVPQGENYNKMREYVLLSQEASL